MQPSLQNVSRFCFGASYAVALILELVQLLRPRPTARIAGLIFGSAGLGAHTAFLIFHPPSITTPYGSLLLLAWVVAVFYLYGALHHRQRAWAVFILPMVLILVGLTEVIPKSGPDLDRRWFTGESFWGLIHGGLLFLALVGVCVGCAASVMYLAQAWRLKSKSAPGKGLRLLSLERLAEMNRRAIVWAFPLLTAGLLVGAILFAQTEKPSLGWTSARVIGTLGLWLAFLVLLYLRYFAHSSNRRLAVLTIAAFGLMLITLATTHPVSTEGPP
jgi:ABC-type transport system involved in cytochrome c biogenesis permease subunit